MDSIGAETVFSRNKYRGLAVSADEAAAGDYKRHLGGGGREWDARGAYQLELLRHLGLQPQHRLVDYGCGPLRAGRFLIRYLQAGCYRGYDFNPDFIVIARDIVAAAPELRDKAPALELSTEKSRMKSTGAAISRNEVLCSSAGTLSRSSGVAATMSRAMAMKSGLKS